MNLSHHLRPLSLLLLLPAHADNLPVRYTQGTLHGFLELRSEGGLIVASGDSFQYLRGDHLVTETIFHYKDGSLDDEITTYTQHHTFHLLSDRHIQHGPSFPHPMDVLVDTRTNQVTVRTPGKDGKDDVKTDHLTLPPDIANGLIPIITENMRPADQQKTVSMVIATPAPRLVKLVITNPGDETCSIVGLPHKAIHYEIKIDLGGIVGLIAPLIGKAPPNIDLWVIPGDAPTFAREQGPAYPEGPLMTIQLASPVWPDTTPSEK